MPLRHLTTPCHDSLLADACPRPRGWYRSARGNLTRTWIGYVLTVFERPTGSGRFAWSIQDGRTVRYSVRTYPTEAGALDAVLETVADLIRERQSCPNH